jgi:dTDP-4-amino-4,6-dideoxygalactose transaminase
VPEKTAIPRGGLAEGRRRGSPGPGGSEGGKRRKKAAVKDIASGLHYPIPLHLQAAYAHLGHRRGDFPVAEAQADELVSLPMCPEMKDEQVEYVCETVRSFFGK